MKLFIYLRYFLTLLCLFFYVANSHAKKFSDLIWIEEIPIFSDIIVNKKDAIEFDSSDGKIIIIQVDLVKSIRSDIYNFYENFFKSKKWINVEKNKNWEKKISKLTKKSFIIENIDHDTLTFKIITQNF